MIEIIYLDKKLKKAKLEDLKNLKFKQIWIDITDITNEEAQLLKKVFNLHSLTIEDLISSNTRIKVEEFPEYLFCVFFGVCKKKPVELIELDFILGRNFLISNHKAEIGSFTNLKKDGERLERLFQLGSDMIFHKLLDSEIDNYFPVLENIDNQLEGIEESLAKKASRDLQTKILDLKRLLAQIKKVTLPQREKISFLAKNDYKFISKKAMPYFRNIYDGSIRVSDAIDNYREMVSNTFDVYMSAISNNLNEVMKTLSIIATIALPLTVISSIYGTNFKVLPGQNFIYGFCVMIFGMFLLAFALINYFKKRKWF